MTRSFLVAVRVLALAAPLAAQGGGGGRGPGRGMGGEMGPPRSGQGLLKGITLTDAQQKLVDSLYKVNEPIRAQMMENMRKQRESGQRPDSAQMAAMRTIRDAHQKQYRDILTPEQQPVFDQNVAEMQKRMQERMRGGGMGGPGGPGGPPPAKS